MAAHVCKEGAFVHPATLALLQDTGWYRADYTRATHLIANVHWGYQRGCDWWKNACIRPALPTDTPSNTGSGVVKAHNTDFCDTTEEAVDFCGAWRQGVFHCRFGGVR